MDVEVEKGRAYKSSVATFRGDGATATRSRNGPASISRLCQEMLENTRFSDRNHYWDVVDDTYRRWHGWGTAIEGWSQVWLRSGRRKTWTKLYAVQDINVTH